MTTQRDEYEFIGKFRAEALEAGQRMADLLNEIGGETDEAKEAAERQRKAQEEANKAMQAGAEAIAAMGAAYVGIRSSMNNVLEGLQEFTQTETLLVNIAKVTSLTEQELDSLSDTFRKNAADTGTAYEQYANLAGVAGQLGIDGARNLETFALAMDAVANASDLDAVQGGMDLAQMLGIADEDISEIDRLGSVVVRLGNNLKTTESKIVRTAAEVQRALGSFGVGTQLATSLGAAMSDAGVRAEAGATSVARVFTEIGLAAAKGGKDADKFADLLGVTRKEFKELAQSNPEQVFLDVLKALNGEDNLIAALDKLGLANAEGLKALTPLITGYERLEYVMALAADEAKNPTAATKEAAAANATLAREYAAMLNALEAERARLGEIFEPLARAAVDAVRTVLDAFSELPEGLHDTILVVAALGPGLLGIASAVFAVKRALAVLQFAQLVAKGAQASDTMVKIAKGVTLVRTALLPLAGPAGLLVLAGVALGGLALHLANMPDDLTAMESATDATTTALEEYRAILDQATLEEGEFGEATAETAAMLDTKTQALKDAAQAMRDAAAVNSADIAGPGGTGGEDFTAALEQIGLDSNLARITGTEQTAETQEFLRLLQGVVDTRGQDIEMVKLLIAEEQRIQSLRDEGADALADYDRARAQALEAHQNGEEDARRRLVEQGEAVVELADKWGVAEHHVGAYRELMAGEQWGAASYSLTTIQEALQEHINSYQVLGSQSVQDIINLATEIHNAFLEAQLLEEAANGNLEALRILEEGGVSAFGSLEGAANNTNSAIANIAGTIANVQAALPGLIASAQSAVGSIWDTMMNAVGGDYTAPEGDLKSTIAGLGSSKDGVSASAALLRQFEGFRAAPYWDVNAQRAGYGSDTVTLADGSIQKVVKGMRVSVADANRDLVRRVGEFQNVVKGQVGADRFNGFTPAQQASLTSIAYNYGSLPDRIVNAVRKGTDDQIGAAILTLRPDNDGVNSKRRSGEASIFLDGVGVENQALSQERETARNIAIAQREAEQEAAKAARETASAAKEAADAERERIEVRKEFLDNNGRLLDQLAFEQSLEGKSIEEKARLRQEYQLLNEAKAAGIALDSEALSSIAAVADAEGRAAQAQEARTQAQNAANEAQAFYVQQQDALKDGILDFILEGESLVDTLRGIANAFARAALEAALFGSGPMGGTSLGGGGGLLGGLFGGGGGGIFGNLFGALFPNAKGSVIPNASGNVVTSSVIMPMAKGGRALIGEAGPEGILPLERGIDGRLGVIAHGGSAPGAGGGMTVVYSPTFNLNTGGAAGADVAGSSQDGDALMRRLDAATRRTVMEVLQREMSNGGMLNTANKTI